EKSKGLQEKIERYITAYDEGARKLLALEISDASLRSLQEEQAKVINEKDKEIKRLQDHAAQ
ncbi:unnamed protein product, partial [Effrenium voratum]